MALNNLGNICYRRGKWAAALDYYSSSLEGFEHSGDMGSEASVLSNVASICFKRGDWSRALDSYQRSLDIFEKLEDPVASLAFLGNLGTFYLRRGERSLALEHFRGAGICKGVTEISRALQRCSPTST